MSRNLELESVRAHLANAEAMLMEDDGLFHLQAGLAELEVLLDSDSHTASIAENVGQTYTNRIYGQVRDRIENNSNLPEPELEHLFAIIRCFDDVLFGLPPESRDLKIDLVRRLIDLYYEGHSSLEKEKIYKKLAEISRGDV